MRSVTVKRVDVPSDAKRVVPRFAVIPTECDDGVTVWLGRYWEVQGRWADYQWRGFRGSWYSSEGAAYEAMRPKAGHYQDYAAMQKPNPAGATQ